jgi:hypothetical protein
MVVLDISKLYYPAFSDSYIKGSIVLAYSYSGDTVAIAPAASSSWRIGTRAILSIKKGGSERVGSWQCQSYCCKCEQGSECLKQHDVKCNLSKRSWNERWQIYILKKAVRNKGQKMNP